MKKSISFLLGLWAALSLAGCSTNNKAAQEEVNVIVAADLHFDLLPETDQYFHVVTMNRLPGQFNFPGEQKAIDKIDGVIIAVPSYDLGPSALYLKYAHRCLAYEVSFRLAIGELKKSLIAHLASDNTMTVNHQCVGQFFKDSVKIEEAPI